MVADKLLNTIVPKTIMTEKFKDGYYSITEYCDGKLLECFLKDKVIDFWPKFLEATYQMHFFDLNNSLGYGDLNFEGNGQFDTWKTYLKEIKNKYCVEMPFWDKNYFDKNYRIMMNLVEKCPEVKALVHGDYGFNNVIANDNGVTGIIDWSDVKIGDYVYDIAYLSFWSKYFDYTKIFFDYYSKRGRDLINFLVKKHVYTIHIALTLLIYFSEIKNRDSFAMIKNKIDSYTAMNCLK